MPRSLWRTGVETCCSAGLTALCWLLWTALGIVIVALAVVLVRRELAVPDFVLRGLEARLASEQLSWRFGRVTFDPTGTLVVEDVAVHAAQFVEPLARLDAVLVELDLWKLLVGDVHIEEVRATGARFDLPAMLSPTGTSQPLLEHVDLRVKRQDRRWEIAHAHGRIGPLVATVRGRWDAPPRVRREPPPPINVLAAYLGAVRAVRPWLPELERMEEPRLDLAFDWVDAMRFELRLAAARAALPGGVVVFDGEVWAAGEPSLTLATTLDLTVRAALVGAPGAWTVVAPTLATTGRVAWPSLAWEAERLDLAAQAVVHEDDFIETPVVGLALAHWPVVEAEMAARVHGSSVAIAAEVDTLLRRADVEFEGRFTPSLLNAAAARLAEWRRSNILARLHFSGPAAARASARFAPGWRLTEARADAWVDAVDAVGVPLDRAEARVRLAGTRLELRDVLLERSPLSVRGTYDLDLATQDFRFLLGGRFAPRAIDPWFSEWWERFWDDFEFPGDPPLASADIAGRWQDPDLVRVWGVGAAAPFALRGVPFDEARARYFVRPGHYDIGEFYGRRGERSAHGRFTRHDLPDRPEPAWIDFSVVGDYDLHAAAPLFGEEGVRTLAPFHFADRAEIAAAGRLEWRGERLREDLRVDAQTDGRFRFHGWPLDGARIGFALRDGTLAIDRIEGKIAGGRLSANASVTGPDSGRKLRFSGRLDDANLAALVRTYAEVNAAPEVARAPLGADGRLSLVLDAEGPLGNLYGLRGEGTAAVVGADLAEFHLLGPLSRLLSGTFLGFTSLRITDAQAAFLLRGEWIEFTSLRFTGPSALVRMRGYYALPSAALDFTATVFPFRESGMPVMGLLGLVLEPITRTLELRLGGTLGQPSWSLAGGPAAPPRQTGEETAPPTASSPADAARATTP